MITEQITGKGMVFPIQLSNGTLLPEVGFDLIQSCIRNILVHDFGKTYFQREFGIGIEKYLDEPNDVVTERSLLYHLRNQLARWDNRITVDHIEVSRGTQWELTLIVHVSLTGTDQTEQLTFPINTAVI